jgi:hypothetical protein
MYYAKLNNYTPEQKQLRRLRKLKHKSTRRPNSSNWAWDKIRWTEVTKLVKFIVHNEDENNKYCNGCEAVVPRVNFWTNKKKGWQNTLCRACNSAQSRNWIKDNPQKIMECKLAQTEKRLLKEYGVTSAQRTNLIEQQERKCAICGTEPKLWHLDHCHMTGRVRGMLCQPCNHALGLFKDNKETLQNAINYLTR